MKEGTYRAYERPADSSKSISMDHRAAAAFGRKFAVSWVWLLTGRVPFDRDEHDDDSIAAINEIMLRMTPDQRAQLLSIARTFATLEWTEDELRAAHRTHQIAEHLGKMGEER